MRQKPCFILTIFEQCPQPLISNLVKSFKLRPLLSNQLSFTTLIEFTAPLDSIKQRFKRQSTIAYPRGSSLTNWEF